MTITVWSSSRNRSRGVVGRIDRFSRALACGIVFAELSDACGSDPRGLCEWVFERTENETLAQFVDWFMERPFRIAVILLVAVAANRLLRRLIVQFTERLSTFSDDRRLNVFLDLGLSPEDTDLAQQAEQRRKAARTETIGQVLRSAVTVAVSVIAVLMVLGELNVNLGPLLAGAGIAGIALGFGAQSIVKDFLSGMFILIEDQFGVGDHVDLGVASGDVERVSMRVTTLRDGHGTVWYIPNGEIRRVGNSSQLSSRAIVDVMVPYETDLRRALEVVTAVAADLSIDPEWEPRLIGEAEVQGVQSLGADGVGLRVTIETEPTNQGAAERELRLRIKEALEAEGVTVAPQRTVWVRPSTTEWGRPTPSSTYTP